MNGKAIIRSVLIVLLAVGCDQLALANGGPFVVRYPSGDPAAKEVLARLDPNLKPARETRLRVIKEDLKISFVSDAGLSYRDNGSSLPLADVSTAYTIENPTDKEIEVDFGFPILRGIYMHPLAMIPTPDVHVTIDGPSRSNPELSPYVISNSVIYAIIRRQSRQVIDAAIAKDKHLAAFAKTAKEVRTNGGTSPYDDIKNYMMENRKWNERDATLLAEYCTLNFGKPVMGTLTHAGLFPIPDSDVISQNLGPLGAIGEQKSTQFFARLAECFGGKDAAGYEAIFSAWGGDVQERSVDMTTGKVRPREHTTSDGSDPTVYARVDYLEAHPHLTDSQRTSCQNVLKNLPVVFTFAPMNLLHYQAKFPPKSTQVLTVSYRQYAYEDTRSPKSYQLAYVVHPASMWKKFGPINLEVSIPSGVAFKGSFDTKMTGVEERAVKYIAPFRSDIPPNAKGNCDIYKAVLKKKTGEILIAIDAEGWRKVFPAPPTPVKAK